MHSKQGLYWSYAPGRGAGLQHSRHTCVGSTLAQRTLLKESCNPSYLSQSTENCSALVFSSFPQQWPQLYLHTQYNNHTFEWKKSDTTWSKKTFSQGFLWILESEHSGDLLRTNWGRDNGRRMWLWPFCTARKERPLGISQWKRALGKAEPLRRRKCKNYQLWRE